MEADVPISYLSSGGIDSSLIVSLMQSESLSPVHTYSIGFKESGYDEAIYNFSKSIECKPTYLEAQYNLMEILEKLNKLKELEDSLINLKISN